MSKKKQDQLSKIQRIVADSYGHGDFSHVATLEEAKTVGDTLFSFLMIELGENEDCENLETALSRVESAIKQLEQVKAALNSAWLEED